MDAVPIPENYFQDVGIVKSGNVPSKNTWNPAPFATIMPAIYFRNILSTIRKHKYGLKISDGKDTIEHFDNI
jgi:hypothetical protein